MRFLRARERKITAFLQEDDIGGSYITLTSPDTLLQKGAIEEQHISGRFKDIAIRA